MTDDGDLRVSDAERQVVVDRLGRAVGDGLITLDEFADSAGQAYAAVTRAQLEEVTRDLRLPVVAPIPEAPGVAPPTGETPDAGAAPKRRWVVAIMGGEDRRGKWRLGRRTGAFALMGGVDLDLRDAVLDGDDIEITAWAIMGGVDVVVPEGIAVECSGFMLMGGRSNRIKDVPPVPGSPVIRVRGYGMWGGISVRSKPPRREGEAEEVTAWERVQRGHLPGMAGLPGARDVPGAAGDEHGHGNGHGRDRSRGRHGAGWPGVVTPPLPPPPFPPVPPVPPVRLPDLSGAFGHRPVVPGDEAGPGPAPTAAPPPTAAAPPPAPAPAPPVGGLVTIVSTDIVGSTRLADTLGDQRWRAVLGAHNDVVREQLRAFGGTEVKTSGDGFLLTFTSARAAVQFGVALQDELAEQRASEPDVPIEVRVGVHAGEVERDGHDVVGRNVSLACRLCDAAAPGEVLVSAVVADLADSASDLAFGDPRPLRLAGIDREVLARLASRR
jgi:class 3 adenylate cyclase